MLTTDEVADREGVKRKTVVEWIEKGWLTGAVQENKGSRKVYKVPVNYKIQKKSGISWQQFEKEWKYSQASGYLTGRPLGEKGLRTNTWGVKWFFQSLGCYQTIEAFTVENLRIALSNIEIDYKEKNCHYSQRAHMYNGFVSVYKLLIMKGLRERADLLELKPFKPKRIFPAKKTVLQEDELIEFIELAGSRVHGKEEFEPYLNKVIVLLMACAGLRREEVSKLKLSYVDIGHGIIHVDGKGYKSRKVGMFPILEEALTNWMEVWRPRLEPKTDALLIGRTGEALTPDSISKRIARLSKQFGKDISPHGLRRTFATLMDASGMSGFMIQDALGHSDIRMTREYVISHNKRLIDFMRGSTVK